MNRVYEEKKQTGRMEAYGWGYCSRISQGRLSCLAKRWLPERGLGTVHSVFSSSLNLKFGGHLVHLDGGENGLCCFGISVSPEDMCRVLEGCVAGDLVVMRGDELRIYRRSALAILDLSAFEEEELLIPRLSDGLGIRRFAALLVRQEPGLQLGIARDGAFRNYSGYLQKSEAFRDLEPAVHFFLGRGQGLTPAGDDILTGYGAVLTALGRETVFLEVLKHCGISGTTEVSRAYLSAMADGRANEMFLQLLAAAQCGNEKELRALLVRLESIGHTSGSDTLYGVYLGLSHLPARAGTGR